MKETGRQLVERIYRAAVAGADPGESVRRALVPADFQERRVFVMALGKAAPAMSAAGLELLGKPAGTLVIGAADGDHPIPAGRSARAADLVERFLTRVTPGDHLLVLLSGGTSSLIGAPIEGISPDDLARLFQLLLGSGLDIHDVNLVRKRFSRWGAGRLAARIPEARIRVLAISDVSGDRIESIGSGPCVPDPSTAGDVIGRLRRAQLWQAIPGPMRTQLEQVQRNELPETPKPGDPVFQRVSHTIVANNRAALDHAAEAIRDLGLSVEFGPALQGDAVAAGRAIAQQTRRLGPGSCLLFGGETTVVLGDSPGLGGRCQELALAAALELEQSDGENIVLLAAGTDGRDGPTDAAGAVIDGKTTTRIRAAGLDPQRCLKEHNSYPALDTTNALLRTGPTGTNVRDVVIAMRWAT